MVGQLTQSRRYMCFKLIKNKAKCNGLELKRESTIRDSIKLSVEERKKEKPERKCTKEIELRASRNVVRSVLKNQEDHG